jgi:CubicO group peptidase (beta-lactamase class C family)
MLGITHSPLQPVPDQRIDPMTTPQSNPAKADLSNWRSPRHSRWAFRHIDQIIATARIENDPADVSALEPASRGLGGSLFRKIVLNAIRTDAMVVLHDGKLVFEWYARGNDAHTRHILMSSTKAVMGLFAGMLHETGDLNLDAPVSTYVPEIATTAYQDATLRNLLDMRTGILLDAGQQRGYEVATNWTPIAAGGKDADLVSFFRNLTAARKPHGGPFSYISANTDLLGWAIERATGQTIAALLSARLWKPMGAEDAAYVTLDRTGLARCAGGLCATARDFARLGQLIVDGGKRGAREIIPAAVIGDITNNGDADVWKNGQWGKAFASISNNMRYRSGWYLVDDQPKTMFAMGIHGQNLFIDRANRIVVAKLSCWKQPIDYLPLWVTHRGFERLQRALTRRV